MSAPPSELLGDGFGPLAHEDVLATLRGIQFAVEVLLLDLDKSF